MPVLCRCTCGQEVLSNEGRKPGKRLYVHMSANIQTAITVGKRHGKPVVFRIQARLMQEDGFHFFLSDNGVWLTKTVPPAYLDILT